MWPAPGAVQESSKAPMYFCSKEKGCWMYLVTSGTLGNICLGLLVCPNDPGCPDAWISESPGDGQKCKVMQRPEDQTTLAISAVVYLGQVERV